METEQILDVIRSGEWTDDRVILDLALDLQSRIRRGLCLGEEVEVELATIAVKMAQIQDGRPLARRLWEVAYHSAMGASSTPAPDIVGPIYDALPRDEEVG